MPRLIGAFCEGVVGCAACRRPGKTVTAGRQPKHMHAATTNHLNQFIHFAPFLPTHCHRCAHALFVLATVIVLLNLATNTIFEFSIAVLPNSVPTRAATSASVTYIPRSLSTLHLNSPRLGSRLFNALDTLYRRTLRAQHCNHFLRTS